MVNKVINWLKFLSGCGSGKYLDVNPSVFNIGSDRCRALAQIAREKDHEVRMNSEISAASHNSESNPNLRPLLSYFLKSDKTVCFWNRNSPSITVQLPVSHADSPL